MSKSAFASAIISKMDGAISKDGTGYSSGTASSAMAAVAEAITEYLIANTTVTIAYVGIIPGSPPTPDPVTTDTFKIVGQCAPPSPSNSFDAWIVELESKIIAGFQLAPSGTLQTVFAQKPFLNQGIATTQSDLKSAHEVTDESPQQKMWEIICGDIIDWVNNIAMNPASGAASRPVSTGTANITKITLV